MFWRRSENPDAINKVDELVLMHFLGDIEQELMDSYCGHHQYDWVRPRKTWLEATCPVYIDFGEEFLVHLGVYNDISRLPCVRRVSKKKFVHDSMTEMSAKTIGTQFYPIS